ncbi:hypothetical protein HPB52_010224 [Rhipicephalus sanguineus]|uniref:Uncharacterized protein n=1 Tax=Rhipicephalus sanguineus TaxID=34632 RepID=A0A9D4PQN3_RHISA|nr:hypothetical protein HPB52_010224 [Rhipicephalus sanguineus]
MGQNSALYEELVPAASCPIHRPPTIPKHVDVHLELKKLSKRRTLACEFHQSALVKLHDRLRGHLLVFKNRSVRDSARSALATSVTPTSRTAM